MVFPVFFNVLGHKVYLHLILEILAFSLSFRLFIWEKKRFPDVVHTNNRLYVILGATIGALIGSRLIGSLEDPRVFFNGNLWAIYQSKTIMGGLFGGLLAVEITKKLINEKASTGDLFVLPIMLGLIIGRIGCFSMGVYENTFGNPTTFFMGMNLGDGLKRHPTSLYEILFLFILFPIFYTALIKQKFKNGTLFIIFMLLYFGFRFIIEFLKPNKFEFLNLTTIQWICIACWSYYCFMYIRNPKLFKKNA